MPSKIIEIKTPDDLKRLNNVHIESVGYESGGNTLVFILNHITWPNKVIVTINISLLILKSPLGSIMYQPAYSFTTQDIVPVEKPDREIDGGKIIQGG
jgi:hypothetical protein